MILRKSHQLGVMEIRLEGGEVGGGGATRAALWSIHELATCCNPDQLPGFLEELRVQGFK